MSVRTDTDERMENLPILQDFVPYQGHCPKTYGALGTADHVTLERLFGTRFLGFFGEGMSA